MAYNSTATHRRGSWDKQSGRFQYGGRMVLYHRAMPPTVISLIPQVQDLKLYGGDGADLQITVSNGAGPIDITGAIDAQIRASRVGTEILAAFTADTSDAANGIVYLSLNGSDTAELHDPKHDGALVE